MNNKFIQFYLIKRSHLDQALRKGEPVGETEGVEVLNKSSVGGGQSFGLGTEDYVVDDEAEVGGLDSAELVVLVRQDHKFYAGASTTQLQGGEHHVLHPLRRGAGETGECCDKNITMR
jgi:hypothetical protein